MKITFDHAGIFLQDQIFQIRFGNQYLKDPSKDNKSTYDHFANIKQVHGNSVVEANSKEVIEADGHWTRTERLPCLIKTADCMPIFILDYDQKEIMAVHAGWRGIENKITMLAVQQMLSRGSRAADLKLYVGPHILVGSFEVQNDVAEKLIASMPSHSIQNSSKVLHIEGDQLKVNLANILISQMLSLGVQESNINFIKIDTMTNPIWNSFRRDKLNSGRNYSWAVINPVSK